MRTFLDVMEEGAKLEAGVAERSAGITKFEEKLVKFIELVANKPGFSRHKREYLLREAETTSDFPNLFGTVIERTLMAAYKIITPDWKNYVKSGTQNDFRPANMLATYGAQSALDVVEQRGEYPGSKIKDGKFAIQLKKYGRRFDIDWEAIINDDLGALTDSATRLARAAAATEQIQAVKLFAQSSGPNTTLFGTSFAHPIDAVTMTNKGTAALTADAIGDVVTAMRNQKDSDGNPISITRFHLVVPPELEITALKALSSAALIAIGFTASAATQTSENVIAKLPVTLHVNEYLTTVDTTGGTKTWYMFADPAADGAAAQLNFLKGHETPEVVIKAPNKLGLGGNPISPMEGDFESDSIAYRVRHVLGGTQLDPRFAYAEAVAN